tara:strand:+ start:506 stop:820 length:315 start_codon:yes stop_codon:yes gene_type:complete
MIVQLTEVVEKRDLAKTNADRENDRHFTLREIYINPDQVICLREDIRMVQYLNEGSLPVDLDPRQKFTKIYMNRGNAGFDVVVVGGPTSIDEKIFSSERQLLKG